MMNSLFRSRLLLTLLVSLCALNLIAAAPDTPLKVGQISVAKVAILGNSITLHGPAENIGWLGNWGMAASSEDKDFSHLLLKKIEQAVKGKPESYIRNIADFEREYAAFDIAESLKPALEFQADLIILAIGENVAPPETDADKQAFRKACDNLLQALNHPGRPTIIVRSSFWESPVKDDILREACAAIGGEFVNLKGLDKDEKNYARSERKFEHEGVAAHPGDRGMEAIAGEIWKGIQRRAHPQSP